MFTCICCLQNGDMQPSQQHRVSELERELSRLRQDGQAHDRDSRQQLESARQAASQARHDAAQATARATYAASQVQQLQDEKSRMADIADNWQRQGREQQASCAHSA